MIRSALRLIAGLAAFAALVVSPVAPAFAAPLTYYNQPFDTPNAATNALITSINSSLSPAATLVTASGTTTSTATGTRLTVSVTGLSTAAGGATSAAMTVTDTAVVGTSSIILCNVNGYSGTGVPVATTIIPAAGSFSFTITNVASSGALNATVPVSCLVFN